MKDLNLKRYRKRFIFTRCCFAIPITNLSMTNFNKMDNAILGFVCSFLSSSIKKKKSGCEVILFSSNQSSLMKKIPFPLNYVFIQCFYNCSVMQCCKGAPICFVVEWKWLITTIYVQNWGCSSYITYSPVCSSLYFVVWNLCEWLLIWV